MNRPTPILFALVLALAGCAATVARADAKVKNVNPDEFERLAKEPNTVVLDTRSPDEYAAGHLKGAVFVNYHDKSFDEKLKALDPSKTYLVYCAVGGRSGKACAKLAELKVPNVYNLAGGIKAWEKAGKPVEK